MRRYSTYFAAFLLLAVACDEEQPLAPGLPMNVCSVSLEKNYWTNSGTIIANSTNAIQFEIKFFDEAGLPLNVHENQLEVWADDRVKLPRPFRFTTGQAGTHKLSIRTADGRILSDGETVWAIDSPTYMTHRLPVIFHYLEPDPLLLSPERIERLARYYTDSLSLVNNAFGNRRGSRDPNAVDTRIEFYAATEDPEGKTLPFPGLEFVYAPGLITDDWESMEQQVAEHYWPPWKYINVWIMELESGGGFAYYPEYDPTESGYPSVYYGVYIDKDARPGTLVVHELGHLLDLPHVFGFDCVDSDLCVDTRTYKRDPDNLYSSSNAIRTGCDNEKFAGVNYMDYYFTENTTFTNDQAKRMHHALRDSPFLPTAKNMSSGRTRAWRPNLSGTVSLDEERLIVD